MTETDGLGRAHERFGWTALAIALVFGVALEGLQGFKVEAVALDDLTREMWSLAHFHAVGLSLVNLVYASRASSRGASGALLAGSVLLPLGFLLGGVGHFESDPGAGIMLAPAGALLVVYAIGAKAVEVWRT